LESTEHGLVPTGEGWFVLNAREAPWYQRTGRGFYCEFEGFEEHKPDFSQLGINLTVLRPGEPMAMYHWEADQEDFLVIAGEALLIVEGEERSLRQWDLVHCPPGTEHTIVGAGETAQTGAHTRRMKPRVATTPGSSERRRIPSTPMRGSAHQSERGTGKAGSPAETGHSIVAWASVLSSEQPDPQQLM
jgi:quercetin dioxygenase-like cupin family protein